MAIFEKYFILTYALLISSSLASFISTPVFDDNGLRMSDKMWEVEWQLSEHPTTEQLIQYLKAKPLDNKCGVLAVQQFDARELKYQEQVDKAMHTQIQRGQALKQC
jgi:hypothetical protein